MKTIADFALFTLGGFALLFVLVALIGGAWASRRGATSTVSSEEDEPEQLKPAASNQQTRIRW
jgi:hypothetical protein